MKCAGGKHEWLDKEDAKRCCDGQHVRVQSTSRRELEAIGAENIVFRQMFRGWIKNPAGVMQ